MIKITDIQKQVIDGRYSYLKPIFKKVSDSVFGWKLKRNMNFTDSDFEDFKSMLEDNGIYVTWKAIGVFYGVRDFYE